MRSAAGVDDLPDSAASGRRVVPASVAATTLEWYAVFLHGTASAFVFGRHFFPTATPLRGTLLALSTWAIGFLARPVGAVAFGHVGDRLGRRPALSLSLLVTGIATVLIGCLPTSAQVGAAATVLLVVLGLAQGVGLGGGWGGATLLAVEHAPADRRGWSGSWPQVGTYAGLLLSTLAFVAVQAVTSDAQFVRWGWRLPFLAGVLLVVLARYVRRRLPESPLFSRLQEREFMVRAPVASVLRTRPRQVVLATGMRIGESAALYLLTVFVLTSGARTLGVPRTAMLVGVLVATLLGLVTTPLFGRLSDRIGRRPLYMAGSAAMIVVSPLYFALIDGGSAAVVWLAVLLGLNLAHDLMYGPQGAWFCELFDTRVRYSGVSVGSQVGAAVGGGVMPLVASWSLATAGDAGAVLCLAASGLVAFLSAWFAGDTAEADSNLDRPPDEGELAAAERDHPVAER
jgi:MHS family shikimate/dehydroshikimate transporter-like MFS transporter